MTIEERDAARMSEDLGTTIWRLRETVRVVKLAATHRLEQMRSLLMHERHKVWKREFGYDRLEIAAEMDEERSRTSTSFQFQTLSRIETWLFLNTLIRRKNSICK